MVINQTGVTLVHGMEHPASGLKNIIHGKGLAALTPAVIEASYIDSEWKFGQVCAADCADAVRRLLRNLDMELTLSDLRILKEDIPWMAENCMKVSPLVLPTTLRC